MQPDLLMIFISQVWIFHRETGSSFFFEKESRPAINKQSQVPFLKIFHWCWKQSDTWKSKYTLETTFLQLINSILIFQRNHHHEKFNLSSSKSFLLWLECCGRLFPLGRFQIQTRRARVRCLPEVQQNILHSTFLLHCSLDCPWCWKYVIMISRG